MAETTGGGLRPTQGLHSGPLCQILRFSLDATIVATRLAARTMSSCSQNRSTFQPAVLSRSSVSRSRLTFPKILFLHQAPFAFGHVACIGQACQKQPSQKTATRAVMNARSARRLVPGNCRSTR
jgi:hypothetical protein